MDIEIEPGPYGGGWLHDPPTESEYDEETEHCHRCGHENASHTRRGCLIINCPCGRG